MYVKLRDAGTIFHDASQNKGVTGSLPAELKATDKVKNAVRAGILLEVKEDEAKAAIKKAEKAADKKASNGTNSQKLANANSKIKGLKTDNETLTEENDELKAQVADLQKELAEGGGDDTALAEANQKVADLKEQIGSLQESNSTLASEAVEKDNRISELEGQLAEATKAPAPEKPGAATK